MKNLLILMFLSCLTVTAEAKKYNEPTKEKKPLTNENDIKPYAKNPWYWQYDNQPILLYGGSDNDNLWQWTGAKLTDHLDLLVSLGGNYVRNTMSDRDEGDTFAFKQVAQGKYDLDEWNDAYWDKLSFFLEETSKRGIIAQLTIWDWFDLGGSNFEKHPLNPANNITWEDGAIKGRDDYYGGSLKATNQQVLELQKKYVDKLLSITFQYGNILYNMTNESSLGEEWENFWAKYVLDKANAYQKEIYLTSMNMVPSTGVRHVLSNRDIYSFVEISQNSQDSKGARGRAHWENVVKWKRIIRLSEGGPMPMNNEKIYGADDGRNYSAGSGKEAEDRFWKNIFGGAASVRFHRPEGSWGSGLTERAQKNIKAMTLFLKAFDVFSAGTYEGIKYVGDSEGYAMANLGKEYAVYFPAGRFSLELDPWVFVEQVSIKYLDIDSGEWSDEETIALDWEEELSDIFGFQRGISITTPDNRPCIAVIKVIE